MKETGSIRYVVQLNIYRVSEKKYATFIFRLDALALSVIATATWLAGWLGGWVAGWLAVCHSRYCIKTTKRI